MGNGANLQEICYICIIINLNIKVMELKFDFTKKNKTYDASQARFGHRKTTTSKNKLKDTPIKHGYHLEDYNRRVVYAHYYNNSELPFYIGTGTLQRAFVFKSKRRNKEYNKFVKDVNLIKVKILAIDLNEVDSIEMEKDLISKYGFINNNGSLVNENIGGRGGSLGNWGKNPNAKPILQYSKSGKFIKEWSCAKEAGFKLLIDSSSISKCCRKVPKYKSAGGYIWKYKNEINNGD